MEMCLMNNTVGQDTQTVNISRGELIPREHLILAMGVSPNTIVKWENAGLKSYSPGTRAKFYDTCEVIDFIKSFGMQQG